LEIASSADFQGLEKQSKAGQGAQPRNGSSFLSLFLFVTIRATTLAPLVVRHFSFTPFFDGTHFIS
jgi:hypothetical protein